MDLALVVFLSSPVLHAAPLEPMTDAVALRVTTADSVYATGAPVDVALTLTNDSSAPVTLQFPSGQRYDLLVLDATGDALYRWASDRAFIQMLGEERIGPGETLEYVETIDRQFGPGRYTVVAILTSSSHPLEDRTPFTVR